MFNIIKEKIKIIMSKFLAKEVENVKNVLTETKMLVKEDDEFDELLKKTDKYVVEDEDYLPFFKTFSGVYKKEIDDVEEAVRLAEKSQSFSHSYEHLSLLKNKVAEKEENNSVNFLMQGRPLSKEEYEKLFFSLISKENFFENGKDIVLKKIWESCKKIDDLLYPLRELGIQYDFDLSGGSVRDFLLNKEHEIKDLDFMVHITQPGLNILSSLFEISKDNTLMITQSEYRLNNVRDRIKIDIEKVRAMFPEELVSSIQVDKKHNQQLYKHLSVYIIELCLKIKENKYKVFHSKKREEESEYDFLMDTAKRLSGVIKLSKQDYGGNYDVDLLITPLCKPEFLNSFDFDICKTSFVLNNVAYNKQFPDDYRKLISRCVVDVNFFADVHNNKFTINVNDRGYYSLKSSLLNHLDRLQEKYPNNELLLVGDPNSESMSMATQILEEKQLCNSVAEITIEKKKKSKVKI